ncbi:hypothetical protein HC891_03810 [Candidatus Gracilibacteria bacterium]|nr:hypothetical protein [Candidatus Gracilibacteria bacterium]
MTLQEILIEIPRLTTREQLLLMEALSSSIRASLPQANPDETEGGEAIVARLLGAFNPAKQAFSDEDIAQMRYEAAMEKHTGYVRFLIRMSFLMFC